MISPFLGYSAAHIIFFKEEVYKTKICSKLKEQGQPQQEKKYKQWLKF